MQRFICSLVVCLIACSAAARVISYAPYTDKTTLAAFQARNTRHFLAIELTNPQYSSAALFQVVLYDSAGGDEPRVVYESANRVYWAALWEDAQQVPVILIAHNISTNTPAVIFSSDGGRNFIRTALPSTTYFGVNQYYVDNGGPFTRGRLAPVRIGNRDVPFVVYDAAGAIWRVAGNGVATRWIDAAKNSNNTLIGSDITGTRWIVRTGTSALVVAGFDGTRDVFSVPAFSNALSGWITPDGNIYFETSTLGYQNGMYDVVSSTHTLIYASRRSISTTGYTIGPGFAVPTHDYSGAWIIERRSTSETRLVRHTEEKSFEIVWTDPTAPEIEALHAGASGKTLLIQVHRPRPQPDRIITDPALAVWKIGEPPPKDYDELFLAEQINKGFVHVDPDRVGDGDPFVFDSGIVMPTPPQVIISPFNPGPGAGSDILQEWGVVRASLKQRLVLPGIGRALGANGSNWTSDVTLYNPTLAPQRAELRFVQAGGSSDGDTRSVILNAREIRLIPDILGTLYGRVGSGALFLTSERGINSTCRTYTRSGSGSYGFGMNAIDAFAAASPRFPVTFAGAFPGANFRTNVSLTDVTDRGSEVTFSAIGPNGWTSTQGVSAAVPPSGQQQVNAVQAQLDVPFGEGGLLIRPQRGFLIASVFAVDNKSNDPTYFPPDISSSIERWIPVIGHVDGANGAQFRTDLFLYNPSPDSRTVYLYARPWNTSESAAGPITVTMKGNESRIIRDAYLSFFGKTGLARLRYASSYPQSGVRVTARIYSLDASGGSYGYLTPPLNGFQMAARGESLEILGVTGGAGYRTNVGIVEMNTVPANNQAPGGARIEIIDGTGKTIDDFTVTVPIAGGMQLNDVFRSRGHGDGPTAALIRVSPTRGQITAYATVTDNATNDSIYLAPYLGAQQ